MDTDDDSKLVAAFTRAYEWITQHGQQYTDGSFRLDKWQASHISQSPVGMYQWINGGRLCVYYRPDAAPGVGYMHRIDPRAGLRFDPNLHTKLLDELRQIPELPHPIFDVDLRTRLIDKQKMDAQFDALLSRIRMCGQQCERDTGQAPAYIAEAEELIKRARQCVELHWTDRKPD